MMRDDPLYDCQVQSEVSLFALRREEQLEDSIELSLVHSDSLILDTDTEH